MSSAAITTRSSFTWQGIQARMLELREFAQRTAPGWNAPSYITHVVAPDATTNPRFILAPWQVGLTEDHSVKGKSKMCYIFDTAHRFILKPYSSGKDPIHVPIQPYRGHRSRGR